MNTNQTAVVETVDAALKLHGLPTYSELALRAQDVADGIEDMNGLPGAVPTRLKKLQAILARLAA